MMKITDSSIRRTDKRLYYNDIHYLKGLIENDSTHVLRHYYQAGADYNIAKVFRAKKEFAMKALLR